MPEVIGGGLAGAIAARDLALAGREVTLYEKTPFPRHKVCGEFLDGRAVRLLKDLPLGGNWIRRVKLIWDSASKSFELPDPALGISRFRLDKMLLDSALAAGVVLQQCAGEIQPGTIIAHGRKSKSQKGRRLFGYKAHHRGGQNDAVELYFSGSGYTGVNPVEGDLTNVCGLAEEEDLKAVGFDMERFVARQPKLAARLKNMERVMEWMFTGPLFYGQTDTVKGYLCGDALSFVDPFTGSGMLTALLTGKMAAESVLNGLSEQEHYERCRATLLPAFRWSSFMRRSLHWPATPYLAALVPGQALYQLSRVRVSE
jgi:menaquinone-9 beta-reductase